MQYGTKLYRYPGELIDDEPEHNAADNEDNVSQNRVYSSEEIDLSSFEGSEDQSFSSDKLFDGYKDFLLTNQRRQMEAEEAAAAKEAGGQVYAKFLQE